VAYLRENPLQPQLLSRTVYFLPAEGGNIGLCAGKEGALLVDIPQAAEVARAQASLDRLAPGPLKFLVNTHAHGDHVAGNAILGEQMPIIAHANVRKRLMADQQITVGIEAVIPAQAPEAWPRLIFDHAMTLFLNEEEVRLIHFPHGHSDSDVIVWFREANVVHLGDILWPGIFPFVDVENEGSVNGLIRNVEKLIELLPASIQIIPGHGPISDMKALKEYHRMLVETTDWICKQGQTNRHFEDIHRAMPQEWRAWSQGFISTPAWIELVLYSYGIRVERA
jgi:cyclase